MYAKLSARFALVLILILVLAVSAFVGSAQTVPTPDDDTLVIAINGEPGSM